MRVIRFCTPGTASSGISTPRSPRATMTASASSMIPSRCCSACGFSILAMMPARPCTVLRASAMSSGRWMKESATQSTSAASAASRSRRSFSVSAPERSIVSGRLTPLRSESCLPCTTSVTARSGADLHAPSAARARRSGAPHGRARAPRRSPDAEGCTRSLLPGVLVAVEDEGLALLSARPIRPRTCRCAVLGPAGRRGCRSAGRAWPRPRGWRRRGPRIASCEVWLMLMRKISAPARKSCSIVSAVFEEGPRVARILIFRRRLIGLRYPGSSAPSAGWSSFPDCRCRPRRNRCADSRGRRNHSRPGS